MKRFFLCLLLCIHILPVEVICSQFSDGHRYMSPVEPAAASMFVVFLSAICPPAGTIVAAVQAVACGAAVIGGYCAYKKHQQRRVTFAQLQEELIVTSGGGMDPNNNWDDEEEKRKHPHGIYKDAPYHHHNSCGRKSRNPKNGQKCLDYSLAGPGEQRIAIEGEDFVVLLKTAPREYHGYVTHWDGLSQEIQRAFIRHGLVRDQSKGKIIKEAVKRIFK